MPERILISGNEAFAEGAIRAGCRFYAGYPITPQNEIPAYMSWRMPEAGGVFLQAESEVAAINMVFGASACGTRAMTSSSSPGISLKQEGISYIAGAQLPAVIVNVMRGGPGLGNIAPSQSDYFQATRGGGHGDYRCIVLAPASVQEAFDCMETAFGLADAYRIPVIVLADAMLGQMMEPAVLRTVKHVLPAKPWAVTGCKGRSPNIVRSFFLPEGRLEEHNLMLQKKYARIEKREQRCEGLFVDDARLILVAYGTMARIASQAVRQLRAKGIKAGLIRPVTLWPFPSTVLRRIASGRKKRRFLAVEMSYGQMLEDVRLSLDGDAPVSFLGRGGGGIPAEEAIVREAMRQLR